MKTAILIALALLWGCGQTQLVICRDPETVDPCIRNRLGPGIEVMGVDTLDKNAGLYEVRFK